jgi:cell division protease FtsH
VSEATARQIDAAIRHLIGEVFSRTLQLLGKNRDVLEHAAQELLVRETLDEAAISELAKWLVNG